MVEGLAGPCLEERVDALVHQRPAARPVLAVGGVLGRAVAHTEDDAQPPAGRQVEDSDVLGDPDGIVQRQQEGGDRDREAGAPAEDKSRQGKRRGAPAVVDAVMLLEIDQVEAVFLHVRAHLESGLVSGRHLAGVQTGLGQVQP